MILSAHIDVAALFSADLLLFAAFADTSAHRCRRFIVARHAVADISRLIFTFRCR